MTTNRPGTEQYELRRKAPGFRNVREYCETRVHPCWRLDEERYAEDFLRSCVGMKVLHLCIVYGY
jgi:hypothetical protein